MGLGVTTTLTDCFITGNTATTAVGSGGAGGTGGGGYAFQSKPNLTNCIFRNNKALAGSGGLCFNTVSLGEIGGSVLTNCTFESNSTVSGSGGISLYQSSPTFVGCSFVKNVGEEGGGMLTERFSEPTLTNCVFQSNTATSKGGGIHNAGAPGYPVVVRLKNCNFLNNSVSSLGAGGAISSLSSTVGLTNCKLHGNSAAFDGAIAADGDAFNLVQCSFQSNLATYGGGINADLANLQATNCSFQANSGSAGGAILANNAQATQLTNCVFFGNGGSKTFGGAGGASIMANYSLFEITVSNYNIGGTNLLTAGNPFASSTDTPLATGSSAIDKGLDSAPGLSGITGTPAATDLAGNPRFVGLNCQVDIGAYEFQQPNSFGSTIFVAGNGIISCATPTVSLTAIGGPIYSFSGPAGGPNGVVSQFDGSERIIVGNYLITRTPLPPTGTAVVNRPGVYTVTIRNDKGCSTTATVNVGGTACP